MVGGHTANALRRNRWATTSQVIVDMAYDFYNADPTAARFFASNNMAVPADVFTAIGGFHQDAFRIASEDRELCDRWRHAGHRLTYAPDALVVHAHDLDFGSFCHQHFRYGRGAMRYHQERARRQSGRLWHDMPFHLQLPRLLRRATHAMTAGERADIAWRLVFWQLCNAAGYVYERVRDLVPSPQRPSRLAG
jgi:GT2 family glycosyltransferase